MSSENNFRNEGWGFEIHFRICCNGFKKYYLKEEMRGEVHFGRGSFVRRKSFVGVMG